MTKSTTKLVVMAAGLGSRYGGLKQMEPVTAEGELLLDFSVYDAVRAGFDEILFVIKPEMETVFRERVMMPISKYVKSSVVLQKLEQLPGERKVPSGRKKPWGTCHAVMACSDQLNAPFAVINADDFYGEDAFRKMFKFLSKNENPLACCMVGYFIQNTLSDQGEVTRGVCRLNKQGYLAAIHETHHIREKGGAIVYREENGENGFIKEGTPVSMNFWGMTPEVLTEISEGFLTFLDESQDTDILESEYLLPNAIEKLLKQEKISVRVLMAKDQWFGMTYREDCAAVQNALQNMKKNGIYPDRLWP